MNEPMQLRLEPGDEIAKRLPLDKVLPADDNLRFAVNVDASMVASVRTYGVLEPLIVTPHPDKPDCYRIVAGHRRREAARKAKLKDLPCVVRELDDEARNAQMLIENLHREGLTHGEKATGYAALTDLGWTQQRIADDVGVHQSDVSRHLKLRDLPYSALDALQAGEITMDDAEALWKLRETPSVLEAIVTTYVKNRKKGAYNQPIDRSVTMHLDEAKHAAAVEAAAAPLKAQGVHVVIATHRFDHAPWEQRLDRDGDLGISAKKHASEPCHGVFIEASYTGNDVKQVPICIDPKRHGANGASELKAKEEPVGTTGTTKADPEERARRKAAREAMRERATFVRTAITGTTFPTEVLEQLVTRRYLSHGCGRLNAEPRERLAELLELDATKARQGYNNELTDMVLEYAAASKINTQRACLALAYVEGEFVEYRPMDGAEDDNDVLLEALGYGAQTELEVDEPPALPEPRPWEPQHPTPPIGGVLPADHGPTLIGEDDGPNDGAGDVFDAMRDAISEDDEEPAHVASS